MPTILGANSVSGGYEIDNSLRFNSGDSPKLTKTFSAGNRKTFTISTWFKRSNLDEPISILDVYTDASNWLFFGVHHSSDKLFLYQGDSGTDYGYSTTQVFRDPAAFYHICLAVDTTQSTAADRVKLFVNGSEVSFEQNYGEYPQNYDTWVNSTVSHGIGIYSDISKYASGYMSEYNFLDGVAKVASDFGEFNDNGVWIPKAYTGAYGTNGFYLEFKETGTSQNSSGIGADTSGNDHHWAVTNLAALDVMPDTPTNNWCTYNPLDLGQSSSGATFSQGNLHVTTTTAFEDQVGSTFGVSSGKWYWETKIQSNQNRESIGAILVGTGLTGGAARVQYYSRTGAITLLNSSIATGATYGDNDVISVTIDLDNNVVKFFKNNALQGTVNSLTAGTWVPAYFDNSNGVGALSVAANFGQDGTFAGLETAGGNADENGYGNFKYAVPSGFYSLCTKNLGEFG